MTDFVAVLKKTIDAQADKSLELRQRVYAKARATIEQKLVTSNASQSLAARRRKILEDAIAEVEASYSPNVAMRVDVPKTKVETRIENVPPPIPDIVGGPIFSLSHGKLKWEKVSPDNDAAAAQSLVLTHLRVSVDDLLHQVGKEGNAFPSLHLALKSYAEVISSSYADLDAIGLWISGSAILSYERAYREQNAERTISNPLEPATAAILEHVCSLHSALAMGIRQSRELILDSDQSRLNTEELQEIAESGDALLAAISGGNNLLDDTSRHYAGVLQEQMHEIGWRSTKQAYSVYITLRNIFHSLVRYSVGSDPNLSSILGLASASMSFYNDAASEFARNALNLLAAHSRHILIFFNHSPELRAYLRWALSVAESVLRQDSEPR